MARSLLLTGAWLISHVAAVVGDLPTVTVAPTAVNVLNVLSGAVTTAAGYTTCQSVQSNIASCSSSLGGLDLNPSNPQLASCLCCSGPGVLNTNAAVCASWLDTAVPSSTQQYSAFSMIASFCASEIKYCTSKGAATVNLSAKTTITSSAASTAEASQPEACDSVTSVISLCAQEHSDFLTATLKSQAACLCYETDTAASSTAWAPYVFGDYAKECASWASMAGSKSQYSAFEKFGTMCHGLGNFLSATTTVPSTASTSSASSKTATVTSTSTGESNSTSTAAQTGQSTGGTTSTPTAVTLTVNPTPSTTSSTAAGAVQHPTSAAFGLGGMFLALLSYLL